MASKIKLPSERPPVALIYVRVSSEEQLKGYSLDTQTSVCKERCQKNEWRVARIFREEGESAKSADRTQLNLMRKYCMENIGKVGYIIVWKLDRFARNQYDHFELRSFFMQLGIELVSATEDISDTATGRAVEGMLAVMAQLENDIKTDRTINGMRAKALDGYWPVGAPWGYKNTLSATGRKIIVPDTERSKVVKFLFEEFSRGTNSYRELAKKVDAMGEYRSKHGRKMTPQLVYKILKNPIHAGWIEIPKFGISVQGKHDPIVSKKLYDEVQDIISGRNKNKKQPHNRANPEFPLRGVKCEDCGGSITGGFAIGKYGNRYPYYNCYNKNCPRKSIKKLLLEEDFTKFLTELTPNEKSLDALAEALRVTHEQLVQESMRTRDIIEQKIQKLLKDLDELLTLRVRGKVEDAEYERMSGLWKAEIRGLESERMVLTNPSVSADAAVEFGIRLVRELPTCWPMLEPGELWSLLKILFPENLLYRYPGFQTPKLSPIYALKSENSDDSNHCVTSRGIEPRFAP